MRIDEVVRSRWLSVHQCPAACDGASSGCSLWSAYAQRPGLDGMLHLGDDHCGRIHLYCDTAA
jgi:hypothetical protein